MQETQETWVWSLGQKELLKEVMATHSSILAEKTPRTEVSIYKGFSLMSQNVVSAQYLLIFLFLWIDQIHGHRKLLAEGSPLDLGPRE